MVKKCDKYYLNVNVDNFKLFRNSRSLLLKIWVKHTNSSSSNIRIRFLNSTQQIQLSTAIKNCV